MSSGCFFFDQTMRMHKIVFTAKSVPIKTQIVVVEVDELKMKHKATVYHDVYENLAMMFAPGKSPSAAFSVSFARIHRFSSRMKGSRKEMMI